VKKTDLRHPSPQTLAAFALGRLGPREQAETERHVAGCDRCCQALRGVPNDTLLERLRAGNTSPDAPAAPAATDIPPEPADHPRYRIVKLLGAGGMGVVYQAEHRLLERTVALKVINRALTRHPTAVERFRQEVKAAGRLAHPNIVVAHDAEQAGDLHFLVMEYVDGVSLARLVEQRGPLPVGQACACARQAALGLQHAHEQGTVHRDVKPGNLMLTRKGQLKILDFGLARLVQEGPAGKRRLTALGSVVGTPDYMAPEQAGDSHQADIRSDVYALGCTLYFLLAGRPPFAGTSMEKMLSHLESEPQALTGLRDDVPPELVAVVGRMMAKDPARRYQTPAEVAAALAAVGPAGSPPAGTAATKSLRPARKRRRLRLNPRVVGPALLALFFLVALAPLVILRLMSGPPGHKDAPQTPGTQNGQVPSAVDGAKRSRPRVLLVLASQQFWLPDYQKVRTALGQDADVLVGCWKEGEAKPAQQGAPPARIDRRLNTVSGSEIDAVVFCGGWGIQEYMVGHAPGSPGPGAGAARKLINDMLEHKEKKCVAAICMAPAILADAGVLRGQRATCELRLTPTSEKLKELGVIVVTDPNEPVVVSGRIVTGRDEDAATAFAQRLLELLRNSD
jgi:putative intracellular protease/amidase